MQSFDLCACFGDMSMFGTVLKYFISVSIVPLVFQSCSHGAVGLLSSHTSSFWRDRTLMADCDRVEVFLITAQPLMIYAGI